MFFQLVKSAILNREHSLIHFFIVVLADNFFAQKGPFLPRCVTLISLITVQYSITVQDDKFS